MHACYLDCAWNAHVCNRRDVVRTFLALKEGARKVNGFEGSEKSAKFIGTIRLPMRLPGGNVTHAVVQNVLYIPVSVILISQGKIMDRGIRGQPLFSGRRKDCNCAADPSDASIRYRLALYASFVRYGLCSVH
jgi:hypothetical protein